MPRVLLQQQHAVLDVNFLRPILDWDGVPSKFYSTIYEALAENINVDSKDFNKNTSNSLCEYSASYSIFGTPQTITLSSNNLVFDFPNLLSDNTKLTEWIIGQVLLVFHRTHPAYPYRSVKASMSVHAPILDTSNFEEHLAEYSFPKFQSAVRGNNEKHVPAVKFGIDDREHSCRARFVFKGSECVANGLYLGFSLPLTKLTGAKMHSRVIMADMLICLVAFCPLQSWIARMQAISITEQIAKSFEGEQSVGQVSNSVKIGRVSLRIPSPFRRLSGRHNLNSTPTPSVDSTMLFQNAPFTYPAYGIANQFKDTCQRWQLELAEQAVLIGHKTSISNGIAVLLGQVDQISHDIVQRTRYVVVISIGLGIMLEESVEHENRWLRRKRPILDG